MKTKEKPFDSVKFMREQRDKLSAMFWKMTPEEIINYLKKSRTENKSVPSA